MCVCELMQSEIGRNTGITGRSGLSDEMDARVLLRRSNHTHTYTRFEAQGAGVPRRHRLAYDAQAHMDLNARTRLLVADKARTRANACHAVNSLKLYTSYWAALQSAGLMKSYLILQKGSNSWGRGGCCSLQSLKSAFNNVINVKVMR